MRLARTLVVLAFATLFAAPARSDSAKDNCVLVVADADQLQIGPSGSLPRGMRPAGVRGQEMRIGLSAARSLLAAHGADRVRLLGGVARSQSRLRFLRIDSSAPGFDARATARDLRASGLFRAAIENEQLVLSATIPNDSFYVDQWHLASDAVETPHLPEAWDLARGDTSVVIGILDTGVDTGHPDLATQIYRNWGEIPGNGLDDDGNGFIDDVHGWDFGDNDNDPRPHYAPDPTTGFDLATHGTHVAGIAGAATNNGEGVAGSGWGCRLMPLKMMDIDGHMTEADAAEAILHAADNGADVINMSFAAAPDSTRPDSVVAAFFQALVNTAIDADIVPVAAAGNEGVSEPRYPAACDSVLSVASTNFYNVMSYFTNWGYWVNVNAPGEDIFSTLLTNYELDGITQFYLFYIYGWDGEHPYCLQDGTSMACPLVAGVAGLVRARYPYLPAVAVIDHIIATGDDEPYDFPIGKKLNAYNAVLASPTGVVTPPPVPKGPRLQALPSPFFASTSLRFTLTVAGDVSLVVYDASGRAVRELARGWHEAGPQSVQWDGLDRNGRPAPSGLYFASLRGPAVQADVRVLRLR